MTRNATGALLLMICVAVSADDGSQTTRDSLIALDRELDAALVKGDIPALERIYADDYEMVAVDGQISNKQERIEMIRSGKDRDLWPHVTDRRARVYGDTGLVLSRIDLPSEHGSAMRSIRVFVRHGGKWQVVHTQVTPIGTHGPAR
jgi:ketosteroid isomerase-like protein